MVKVIVANWKENPQTETEAVKLAKGIDAKNVIIAVPFPFLNSVKKNIRKATLAAQDVAPEMSGPFTGEVSPTMLKNIGVQYVIIGHSEQRALGETDIIINKKIKVALEAGLKVILCVGESAVMRKKGLGQAKNFVKKQLIQALKNISPKTFKGKIIIAYEPIWAIGTGKSDKPEETAEMAKFIKKILNTKVLYGGSVIAKNARGFLSLKEIDGALVGGASLRIKDFRQIISIAR